MDERMDGGQPGLLVSRVSEGGGIIRPRPRYYSLRQSGRVHTQVRARRLCIYLVWYIHLCTYCPGSARVTPSFRSWLHVCMQQHALPPLLGMQWPFSSAEVHHSKCLARGR